MIIIISMFVHLPLIVLLAMRLRKNENVDGWIFWCSFIAHLLCGWAVGLLYLFYYKENDTWALFNEAVKLSEFAKSDIVAYLKVLILGDQYSAQLASITLVDRSLLFIRLTSAFNLISFNSYWTVSAYFSLISFAASWFVFQKIVEQFNELKLQAAVAFLFWPSVLFWSSGIIKETLALSGIYFLAGYLIQFVLERKVSVIQLLIIGLSIYISWGLKYYWAAIFLAVTISILLYRWAQGLWDWVNQYKVGVWFFIFGSLLVLVSFLHPNFNLDKIIEVVISNHDLFVQASDPNSAIHFQALSGSWFSLVRNSPLALFSSAFRPLPWEAVGTASLVASFENVCLLAMAFVSLSQVRELWRSSNRLWLWAIILYVILLGIFLALSTPNFGTLSRYRVGFLPFFVFLILTGNQWINRLWSNLHRN